MLRPPSSDPESVSQYHARAPKIEGCEKKNGSSQRHAAAHSQAPTRVTSSPACSATMRIRFSPGIGGHDLLFQIPPQRFVEVRETRDEPRLLDVAGTRQRNPVVAL